MVTSEVSFVLLEGMGSELEGLESEYCALPIFGSAGSARALRKFWERRVRSRSLNKAGAALPLALSTALPVK